MVLILSVYLENMMSKQLIFCVETNSKALTDSIYINEYVREFYLINNDIKITFVKMASKQKYKSKDVCANIKKSESMFKGDSFVLMCVDTDNINSNQVQKKEFYDIQKYCEDNGYRMIWFNLDIEDVFYGHRIEKKDKTKEAGKFRNKHLIEKIKEVDFKKRIETQHGSNLALILDELLERKE